MQKFKRTITLEIVAANDRTVTAAELDDFARFVSNAVLGKAGENDATGVRFVVRDAVPEQQDAGYAATLAEQHTEYEASGKGARRDASIERYFTNGDVPRVPANAPDIGMLAALLGAGLGSSEDAESRSLDS